MKVGTATQDWNKFWPSVCYRKTGGEGVEVALAMRNMKVVTTMQKHKYSRATVEGKRAQRQTKWHEQDSGEQ